MLVVVLAILGLASGWPSGEFSANMYIRWGRTVCGSGDALIYSGQAASSMYTQSGSGANVLCLTNNTATRNIHSASQDAALLYAVRYVTNGYGVDSLDSVDMQKMPCAVCQTQLPTFMQPANVDCPEGFRNVFQGWLMSSHYTHNTVNYICVDGSPQGVSTGTTTNFALLYPVESENIHQYVNNLEVTCSVCESAENTGSTYVRWGRTSCGASSDLVYAGTVAGSHHGHGGSGANLLCFPEHPTLPDDASSADENGGLLYPFEYEISLMGDILWDHLQDNDVPCSVCQTRDKPSSFMLPGRPDCPTHYTEDFEGILMSGNKGHARLEHICVDKFAEGVEPKTNQDLGLLYRLEIAPPEPAGYTVYRELTCAQCSGDDQESQFPVYKIWGKTSCPAGSTRLYKGIMGASHYSHGGGGHNYLCLHETPIMTGSVLNANQNFLYQVEYETVSFGVNDFARLHDYEAPCAVCQTQFKQALFMLPGSYQCPDGWDLEYAGYLMAEHYTHAGETEYICVSELAETVGSSASQDGGLLYPTETENDLASGYINNYEVSCAVCSQPTPYASSTEMPTETATTLPEDTEIPIASPPASTDGPPRGCGSCTFEHTEGPPGGCSDVGAMQCVCLDVWGGIFADCCYFQWREACVAVAVELCNCYPMSTIV